MSTENSIGPADESGFKDSTHEPPSSHAQELAAGGAAGADRGMPGLTPTKKKNNVRRLFFWAGVVASCGAVVAFLLVFASNLNFAGAASGKEVKLADGTTTTLPAERPHGPGADLARDRAAMVAEAEKQQLRPPASAASGPAVPDITGEKPINLAEAPPGATSREVSSRAPATQHRQQAVDAPAPAASSPESRRLSGNVLAFQPSSSARMSADDADRKDPVFAGAKESAIDQELTSSMLLPGRAKRRSNPSLTLGAGALLPCPQDTAIVSGNPGLIRCFLSKDIYSEDGSVKLLARGSQVVGEQRRAVVRGSNRIIVLWTRVKSEEVQLDLNSPGTDALGANGILAWVDDHFWQRFGGALLVSIVDDVVAAAVSDKPSGGQNISFTNTTGTTQQMAAKALESTINIPPTAYSHHGSDLKIFVARDIDFGSVYELAVR